MKFLTIYMNKTGDFFNIEEKHVVLILQRTCLVLQLSQLDIRLGNGALNKEDFVQGTVFKSLIKCLEDCLWKRLNLSYVKIVQIGWQSGVMKNIHGFGW